MCGPWGLPGRVFFFLCTGVHYVNCGGDVMNGLLLGTPLPHGGGQLELAAHPVAQADGRRQGGARRNLR